VGEHGDWVGRRGEKFWGMRWTGCCSRADEFTEEDLSVAGRTAGCGVGGDGGDGRERLVDRTAAVVFKFDDELDGSDAIERGDGAAGDDGEIGGERRDGDEAEIGTVGDEVVRAERGLGVADVVALGECGVAGWVLEVPHERRRVEEVDGGDAKAI